MIYEFKKRIHHYPSGMPEKVHEGGYNMNTGFYIPAPEKMFKKHKFGKYILYIIPSAFSRTFNNFPNKIQRG